MLKEYSATIRYFLAIIDTLLIPPVFYIAYYLRTGPLSELRWFPKVLSTFGDYGWLIFYLIIFTPIALYLVGAYQPFRREIIFKAIGKLSFGIIMVMIFGGAIVFLRQEWVYSRSLLIIWGLLYCLVLFAQRLVIISFLRSIRRRGFNYRQIGIVGTGHTALELISEIQSHSFWGIKIEGVITEKEESHNNTLGLQWLGSLKNIDFILQRHALDDLYFTLGPTHKSLEKLAMTCTLVGCSLYVVPWRGKSDHFRISTEQLGSMPLISYRTVPKARLQLFIKRVMDLLLASLVMIMLPFIYVIAGVLIKLDSPGPVLYTSVRVAHNRRRFRCYKFRTMVNDAERLIHLLDKVDETDGPVRKSSRDPRITKVGRFLRKYSIDEIPQFINVFKGEISLVGPRPPLPDEVEHYRFSDLRRLSMPQGITGLWQVSGRDVVKSFDERLKLDLQYIDNWSLWLDLKIILKTFAVVLKGGV
jgi:exopolysaccharide biosynthesis polyprenyl glycosylphosphotransferase